MHRSAALLFAIALAAGVACQAYTDSTPRRVLDTDFAANYARVFGGVVPADVEIVHSVVIDYAWRPLVVTTDDWAFEIVAPRAWIEETTRKLHLDRVDTRWRWGFEDLEDPARLPAWYHPTPLEGYERYVLTATDIPYVHMLVSATPEPDSRYRVFTRKR